MTFEVWVIMVTRAAYVLAGGEIALRYAAWALVILRRGERPVVLPLIVGVACFAFTSLCYESFVLIIRASPARMHTPEILLGYHFPEATRLLGLVAALYLAYPVMRLQYNYSTERVLVETTVRLFLIVASVGIGWEGHKVYSCLVQGLCATGRALGLGL